LAHWNKNVCFALGLELQISFHAEIDLAVCGAPSGKKLNALNVRLAGSVCFLPLWPGDIQGRRQFETFLFETGGRKERDSRKSAC